MSAKLSSNFIVMHSRFFVRAKPHPLQEWGTLAGMQLPGTIAGLAGKYGEAVDIRIYDTSSNPARKIPVSQIDKLRYNGNEGDLLAEQQRHLDTLYSDGIIGSKLYKDLSQRSQQIQRGAGKKGTSEPG